MKNEVVSSSPLGLAEFELDGSMLPRCFLEQASSRNPEAQPGAFYFTLFDTRFDSFPCRFLTIVRSRQMFGSRAVTSGGVVCFSLDMIAPDRTVPEPQASECASCPQAQWTRGTQPACSEVYHTLCVDDETLDLWWMSWRGLAHRIFRQAIFSFLAKTRRKEPLFAARWLISSRREVNDKGTFWIPQLTHTVVPPSDEVIALYHKWCGASPFAPQTIGEEQ